MSEVTEAADLTRRDLRDALATYLVALADDELLIGHRHSEWTGFAPDIESDIALSSIAQEEIGHARLLYDQAGTLLSQSPDDLAFGRQPAAFRNAILVERPNGDWGYTIARMFLYDHADQVRLDALASGSHRPLAELAAAVRREEKYHVTYGEQWLRRLAEASEVSHTRVQEALQRAWPEATGLFESPSGQQQTLLETGVLSVPAAEQMERWQQLVRNVVDNVDLLLPPAVPQGGGGGRVGRHSEDLELLVGEMTSVWRSDPKAKW
jgi:ring-1,2-phenylacetyl-CoA epoxidase subunit PaaC